MKQEPEIPIVSSAQEIEALAPDTTTVKGNDLADADLAGLARLQELETVYLDGCNRLGDGAFPLLSAIRSLRVLYISGHGITDEGLALLTACRGLEEFGLDANITGKGFLYLSALPELRELHLPGWRELTGDGVAAVASLPNLSKLCFYGTKVLDDEMLGRLAGAAKLEELVLMGCPNVTEGGADNLMNVLPDCMVVRM